MNPVIGQLMRNGQTVFYAYIDGMYVERNTVAEMDECIRIGDRMLIALRGRSWAREQQRLEALRNWERRDEK